MNAWSYLHFFLDGPFSVGRIPFAPLLVCTLSVKPVPVSQTDQVGDGVLVQLVAPLNSCSSMGIPI